MANSLLLLIADRRDRFRERGAAPEVAPLKVAIVVAGGVAQDIVERVRLHLRTLPVSIRDQIGVHRWIPFIVVLQHLGASSLQIVMLVLLWWPSFHKVI